ncbi:hypothetical protein SEA_AKHILA_79 [Mycobacterium phage Akhila]|nr:hypothetical protein SEA_AKHILA_79 [Mycobacterium phage Akhila]UAJ16680.1 hypothetical protein SEA_MILANABONITA_78 [Mycobacterium phage MilanaBonita]
MSDVVERAKAALVDYEVAKGSRVAVAPGRSYRLLAELVAEVERLRPKVVETVEQLDALPIRSLVRSDIGEVFERLRGGWDCLHEDGSAGLVMPFAIRLPARVLYIPTDSLEEA